MLRRKGLIATVTAGVGIMFLVIICFWIGGARPVQAQYQIEGWPIQKSWGAIRGNYIDPTKRDLRLVFEDTAGTVRIVSIDTSVKTAVIVAEFKRQ